MREEMYVYHNLMIGDIRPENKFKVLAYRIKTEHLTQCFLRVIDTKLVNPSEYNMHQLVKSGEEFVKVTEEHFNKYLDIIHNKSRVPLKSLERLI